MARKRIGELLLERGHITRPQLDEGLAHQRATKQRLGVALIQLGFLSEDQLAHALGEALALEVVNLEAVQPDWSAIHLVRARFCETHDLFPYAVDTSRGRKQLVVAMSDPLNVPAVEEVEFTTGLKVLPRLATLSQVRAAILRYYHKVVPDDSTAGRGARVVDTGPSNDEEVIVGEELGPVEITERTSLEALIAKREAQRRERRASKGGVAEAARDLDYLFGAAQSEADGVEELERKFWALMRIMARKGLITRDEFTRELDDE